MCIGRRSRVPSQVVLNSGDVASGVMNLSVQAARSTC
jgi:hypothetical protein